MPTYEVRTDRGTFEVDLDREPDSPEQLRSLVEAQLGGGPGESPASGATRAFDEPATAQAPSAAERFARIFGEGLTAIGQHAGDLLAGSPAAQLARTGTVNPDTATVQSRRLLAALGGAAQSFTPVGPIQAGAEAIAAGLGAGEPAARTVGEVAPLGVAVGPGVARLGKRLAGGLAPAAAKQTVRQEAAIARAEAIPGETIKTPISSDEAFAAVRAFDVQIPLAPFKKVLAPFRAAEARIPASARQAAPEKFAQEVEAMAGPDGTVPFQTLFESARAAGRQLRAARDASSPSPDAGGWAQVFKALRQTIDDAAGRFTVPASAAKSAQTRRFLDAQRQDLRRQGIEPDDRGFTSLTAGTAGPPQAVTQEALANDALRTANEAFSREQAREELNALVAKAISGPRQGDLSQQIRVGPILDAITSKKPQFEQFQTDLARAITPEERTKLIAGFEAVGKTKPLRAGTGVDVGSGRRLGAVGLGGGLGTAAGLAAGLGPVGASVTGGLGAFAGNKAADIVTDAILSPRGRGLLMRLLATKTTLSPAELRLLAAATAGTLPARPGGPREEP